MKTFLIKSNTTVSTEISQFQLQQNMYMYEYMFLVTVSSSRLHWPRNPYTYPNITYHMLQLNCCINSNLENFKRTVQFIPLHSRIVVGLRLTDVNIAWYVVNCGCECVNTRSRARCANLS